MSPPSYRWRQSWARVDSMTVKMCTDTAQMSAKCKLWLFVFAMVMFHAHLTLNIISRLKSPVGRLCHCHVTCGQPIRGQRQGETDQSEARDGERLTNQRPETGRDWPIRGQRWWPMSWVMEGISGQVMGHDMTLHLDCRWPNRNPSVSSH